MEVLDGIDVALALHERPQVAAQHVAGGHAGAHGQRAAISVYTRASRLR